MSSAAISYETSALCGLGTAGGDLWWFFTMRKGSGSLETKNAGGTVGSRCVPVFQKFHSGAQWPNDEARVGSLAWEP